MSAPQIPAGGSFFDTLTKNFKDVPIDAANDNAIDATAFCDASESLVTLFGAYKLLSTALRSSLAIAASIALPLNVGRAHR